MRPMVRCKWRFRSRDSRAAGAVSHHVHSFEETFYVIEGDLVVDLPEGSFQVGAGDYGLIPVGVTHALRNVTGAPCELRRDEGPPAQGATWV